MISALSQIAIPTPIGVSVTLQTFAIALTAFLLNFKLCSLSVICYCLIGSAGAPVFAGFSGGLPVLFGASGGFIFAFPVFAAILSATLYVNIPLLKTVLCGVALTVLYAVGTVQFSIVTGNSYIVAISLFIPYFIKDVAVVAIAYFLGLRLRGNVGRFIHLK